MCDCRKTTVHVCIKLVRTLRACVCVFWEAQDINGLFNVFVPLEGASDLNTLDK